METDRISELLRPFVGSDELSAEQNQALQAFLGLLLRWNARTNLTAIRGEDNIVTRHIGESLFTARLLISDPAAPLSVIDVGSGAGFPGLPLKVWAPGVDLTLVESQNKKVTFLREAIRTLHLDSARVFGGRAESLGATADLVTLRAVEQFESVVRTAASLVRSDSSNPGRLALLIGAAQVPKAELLLPDFDWRVPEPIPLSASRVVLVGQRRRE